MQLNVFNTDSNKSGFRLQYMEVFNWGTFDEVIHSIRPVGETSLLTGANGSGKTTFVDALLTLIVPEKKYRFYNQSSGSEKKGDRTEDSYVMGGYGTINSESTNTTKTLYLRENKEEAYSILLANFANEADQYVTLFQVRYFSGGEMQKMFAVAHKPLHIEDDFRPFDLNGNWKKRIDTQYNKGSRKQVEWFSAASRYAQRLVEVLGMQSIQALALFNQTVGIKVLGNLDEFIRMHMLEPRNMEDVFIELKEHLGTLLDAQRNIEKAETQIGLLKSLSQHYNEFDRSREQLQTSKQEAETAIIWNSFTKNNLLSQAINESKDLLKDLQEQLIDCKRSIDDLKEKERNTRNELEQNKAGQRLHNLELELKDLNEKLRLAEKNHTLFAEWATTLHIEEADATDETSYKRIVSESKRAKLRLEREQRLNDDDDFEAKNILNKSKSEKDNIEQELNVLLQSKNNIPRHLIELRKEICANLKIETNDVPFAGELMQVKHEEHNWEPALEKLLSGFALRLLVPEKHYKKVNKYVNNTNLRSRLVYYHVGESALELNADDNTVFHKLDFHPEHKLTPWIEQQVIRQFDYVCLQDEKTLDRYDKAITINGLVKNRDRHEKDDRPDRNDPSRYVMGWNNEKKKEAYIKRREVLVKQINDAEETLQRCKRKAERLQAQSFAVMRIESHDGFGSINLQGIQRNIRNVEEQMASLKESSNQLKTLTKQLEEILSQLSAKDDERTQIDRQVARKEMEMQEMEFAQQQLMHLLKNIEETDKDHLLQFQQQHADALANISLQNIDAKYNDLKEKINNRIADLQNNLHKEETALNKSINRIKNPSVDIQQRFPDWNGDVQQLSDDAAYALEYVEWLQKLEQDNLPKYKKDFENFITTTMTYKIGGLNEEMEKWEREIKNSIVRLNQSLSGINFNRLPDTFIQLGIRSINDATVKAFRNQLLEALPQASNWQQNSFEDKAAHFREKIQPLISSLDESETYRNRVLDVRNWFEFWADEKFRNTNELKKTYRQMGQLSGGEKAQLTYTILCSAIAYQFGITREGKNTKSLRFIAVDESFSNQDEEKATYLMELCKQLHLQLLVVTPSDKIQIVQDFIAHVHLVQRKPNGRSVMYNMTIKELKEKFEEEQSVA